MEFNLYYCLIRVVFHKWKKPSLNLSSLPARVKPNDSVNIFHDRAIYISYFEQDELDELETKLLNFGKTLPLAPIRKVK